MDGFIYLEDGSIFRGQGFGACNTKVGELVFNTAMVGYQGILTDPACKGQIINMTYPLIGNYGINDIENESDKIQAFGLVVKDLCDIPSNAKSIMNLDEWMKQFNVPGVQGIDTRMIARKIREGGTMKCVITTEDISFDEAERICEETALKKDLMKTAGVSKPAVIGNGDKTIAIMDFGIKQSSIDALLARKCQLHLFPYGTSADEILDCKPDGIFLSAGPGDPNEAEEAIEQISRLLDTVPIFGKGLGHQLLALAFGGRVYKLKYGHRGGNHGVYDKETGKSFITSQNHGYAVSGDSIVLKGLEGTHINLNDGTLEGMKHRELPILSVQFEPEFDNPDLDSGYIFDRFFKLMDEGSAE